LFSKSLRSTWLLLVVGLSLVSSGCAATRLPPPDREFAPAFILGDFVDDYGIEYSIQPDMWFQQPHSRYRVYAWHTSEQYLIALNEESNPSDQGLWTRIDWLRLPESDEYEWAFCYAVYRAETVEEAIAAAPTGRESPRTGCNGFPFSRMKRPDPTRIS
jgi:hypothetical protein